jgi:hypothetical protein
LNPLGGGGAVGSGRAAGAGGMAGVALPGAPGLERKLGTGMDGIGCVRTEPWPPAST